MDLCPNRSVSAFAALPVVWVTAGMSDAGNKDAFAADEVCDVVRKPRDVDAAIATGTLTPQERLADDGCANALDLGAKPGAQAWHTPLIVSGRLLGISGRLREKLEHCAHWPGAISRNRAKTSAAGTD
jgi:hypothetical protein